MKTLTNIIKDILDNACDKAGYSGEDLTILPCNVAGMGDFQCNNAMVMAKKYGKSPRDIATDIVNTVEDNDVISDISIAGPGFINITIDSKYLGDYVISYMKELSNRMMLDHKNIIIDYGGANVAKPLHVGHMRSAVIGESIKRICKFAGNNVLGDVHLGDFGLQMGMVISEIERRHPDLVYFDKDYAGEYPNESPITIKDLETLYPEANAKAKSDENIMNQAKLATLEFQNGRRGYVALINHILNISKTDLKKSYDSLNVNFDLWLGESDSKKYCDQVIEEIQSKNLARVSEGALIVDVASEGDKIDVPPFILKKSDGAILYSTTDLATIVQREKEYNADRIIYVVDNRQEMHFTQLFRCVEKTGILDKKVDLDFVGFGTMNGKDGKPYKTRDGGVMQLKMLINEVKQKAFEKVSIAKANDMSYSPEEMKEISDTVAISALKFADLSIFRSKDYIFDVDKFCSFEGKTGPYLLYTITRAKSILRKVDNVFDNTFDTSFVPKNLLLALVDIKDVISKAYVDLAPSYLCDYVYNVANLFNSFYNSCNIINEENLVKKNTWLNLTKYTLDVMEMTLDLLGIKTLNKM